MENLVYFFLRIKYILLSSKTQGQICISITCNQMTIAGSPAGRLSMKEPWPLFLASVISGELPMTRQVGALGKFSKSNIWTVAESAHLACLPSHSLSSTYSSSSIDPEHLPWPVWDNKSDYSACRHLQWVGWVWINKMIFSVHHQTARGWWVSVRGVSLRYSCTHLLHRVLHQLGGSHHGHNHLLLLQVCHINLY